MVLSLAFFSAKAQEEVAWMTLQEAIAKTRESPRKIMVDVYTDWCGWCKRMDRNTFSNPVIARYINTHFYPVKLNAETKKEITLGDRTYSYVETGRRGYNELAIILLKGQMGFPSISWLDSDLTILDVVPGYKTPQQLEAYLAYYQQDAYRDQTIEMFTQEFEGSIPQER